MNEKDKELYDLFEENDIGHLWGKEISAIGILGDQELWIEFEDGTSLEIKNKKRSKK